MQSIKKTSSFIEQPEKNLVTELIQRALPIAIIEQLKKDPTCVGISISKSIEGSAKSSVLRVQAKIKLPFIVMIDSTHNLSKEIEKQKKLPNKIKNMMPVTYLTKVLSNSTTVAVIEDVGTSVSQLIANGEVNPLGILEKTFKELNEVYISTRKKNDLVTSEELYINWMKERTRDAASKDSRFREILENGLFTKKSYYQPLQKYIDEIRTFSELLQPPITTFIHGDQWPSGWIVHSKTGKLSLIDLDPYHDWVGDYLYDEAKIGWYLLTNTNGLNPIPSDPFYQNKVDFALLTKEDGFYRLEYFIKQPTWIRDALRLHIENVEKLAFALTDPFWCARYELALGATFVGLTRKAILRYGDLTCAAVLYAIGCEHLQKCIDFCLELQKNV